MFTVKHIQHGIETLYPQVLFVTHHTAQSPCGVEIVRTDGRTMFEGKECHSGSGSTSDQTIYVMNENGKTVSTYTLS